MKTSSVSIKFCSFMFSICSTNDWCYMSLGSHPSSVDFLLQLKWPLSGWLLLAYSFPWQMLHALASLTSWSLQCSLSFILRVLYIALSELLKWIWPCYTLLDLTDLPLKNRSHNSCILYAFKPAFCITARSAASLSSIWDLLDHSFYSLWVLGSWTCEYTSLGRAGYSGSSLIVKESIS